MTTFEWVMVGISGVFLATLCIIILRVGELLQQQRATTKKIMTEQGCIKSTLTTCLYHSGKVLLDDGRLVDVRIPWLEVINKRLDPVSAHFSEPTEGITGEVVKEQADENSSG